MSSCSNRCCSIQHYGATLHSALRLPLKHSSFIELSSGAKASLQQEFADVRFIIIDGFSMVGATLLAMVYRRLRQIFPGEQHHPFGGRFIWLMGDIKQLPPVCDRILYGEVPAATSRNSMADDGQLLYRTFDQCFKLTVVQRQQDDSNDQ